MTPPRAGQVVTCRHCNQKYHYENEKEKRKRNRMKYEAMAQQASSGNINGNMSSQQGFPEGDW